VSVMIRAAVAAAPRHAQRAGRCGTPCSRCWYYSRATNGRPPCARYPLHSPAPRPSSTRDDTHPVPMSRQRDCIADIYTVSSPRFRIVFPVLDPHPLPSEPSVIPVKEYGFLYIRVGCSPSSVELRASRVIRGREGATLLISETRTASEFLGFES
jgi:hypothetical protein